jgi:hypothetical protein
MSFSFEDSPSERKKQKRSSEFDSSESNSEWSSPSHQQNAVAVTNSYSKKRKLEEQKEKHNLTSKRGRQRINTEINALKELIPECRDVGCHKAFVLESAVATLKKLIAQNEQLQNENVRLQQEVHKLNLMNSLLIRELEKACLDTTLLTTSDLSHENSRGSRLSSAEENSDRTQLLTPASASTLTSNVTPTPTRNVSSVPPTTTTRNLIVLSDPTSDTSLSLSVDSHNDPPLSHTTGAQLKSSASTLSSCSSETILLMDSLPLLKTDESLVSCGNFLDDISLSEAKSVSTLETDNSLKALTSIDLPPEFIGAGNISLHPFEVLPPHTSLTTLQDYAIPNVIPKTSSYTFSFLFLLLFVFSFAINSNLWNAEIDSEVVTRGRTVTRTLLSLADVNLFPMTATAPTLFAYLLFAAGGFLLLAWFWNVGLYFYRKYYNTAPALGLLRTSSSQLKKRTNRTSSSLLSISKFFRSSDSKLLAQGISNKRGRKSSCVLNC